MPALASLIRPLTTTSSSLENDRRIVARMISVQDPNGFSGQQDIHQSTCGVTAGGTAVVSPSGAWLVGDVRLDTPDTLAASLAATGKSEWALFYPRHRRPLELASCSRAQRDAALLLAAWECWGSDALIRVTGDFAFAVWEPHSHRLTLGRDALGNRPLLFHRGRCPEGLPWIALSSLAIGIISIPDTRFEPDDVCLSGLMLSIPELSTRSFHHGISRVLPGHLSILSDKGIEHRRWWEPSAYHFDFDRRPEKDSEIVTTMRERLISAIRGRIDQDCESTGCHLSGGLDSGSVAMLASSLLAAQGKSLTAYTSIPDPGIGAYLGPSAPSESGRTMDEEPFARAVAAAAGIRDHIFVPSASGDPRSEMDTYARLYGVPLRNPFNAVWWEEINQAASLRGQRTLLTGVIGNLTLSYRGERAHVLRTLFKQGQWSAWLGEVWALASQQPKWLVAAINYGIKPLITRPRFSRQQLLGRNVVATQPGWMESMIEQGNLEEHSDCFLPNSGTCEHRLKLFLSLDQGAIFAGTRARWNIELRDPTSCGAFAAACLELPDRMFLHKGVDRRLVRLMMANRMPSQVLNNHNKGRQSPDWFYTATRLRKEIAEEIDSWRTVPVVAERLDLSRLAHLVDHWPDPSHAVTREVVLSHRVMLFRSLAFGRFLNSVRPD